jgi:lipoprotein-releasing system permease protein
MKIKNVNLDIAITHIFTRKRQTIVAALGVTVGIAIYLFMNSLSAGFTRYSRGEIFKSSAHLKIYQKDITSMPLVNSKAEPGMSLIVNPQLIKQSKTIVNPDLIISNIKESSFVTNAIKQVNAEVYYLNGNAQLPGTISGVDILEADDMFNISSTMVVGTCNDLDKNLNGILIGKGIAEKLNIGIGDYLVVNSSYGVNKSLKVVGIMSTGNSMTDQSKAYVNINTAQQLVKQGAAYVSTIYANTINPDKAGVFAETLQPIVPYTVEPWQITNADFLSGDKVRSTLMGAISISILIVAAFGIYNILNMTVVQKMNDIAILKAVGFSGRDVIQIFVTEAIFMGIIGCIFGLLFGALLISIMSNIYMGGPVGNFPIYFDSAIFMNSFILGFVVTLGAGFFPALKASKVDPVNIFRR